MGDSSFGQLFGFAVGALVGYFFPGGGHLLMNMFMGASIGMAVGGMIDPPSYDSPDAGQPELQDISITMASEGAVIPEVLGTTKITGNVLHYWGSRNTAHMAEHDGQEYESGRDYYLSWIQGICMGPVDTLYAIYLDENIVWYGEAARPENGQFETVLCQELDTRGEYDTETSSHTELTVNSGLTYGNLHFYFGTDNQEVNENIEDTGENRNIPYRGVCYAYFDDFQIGQYNRAPIVKFIVGKYPELPFNPYHKLNTFDYNPAHAIYYTLVNLAYVPSSFIDEESFSEVATLLYEEGVGMGILINKPASAISYISKILFSFDVMTYYGDGGKIYLRLIREDE